MMAVDYILLALLAASALVGLVRGLIREALSLAVWVAGFWCAARFGGGAGALLAQYVGDPMLNLWAGRIVVFVFVLFAGSLIGWLVGYVVHRSVITGVDRMLGMVFGLARGVFIAALLVLGLQLGGFEREPWWDDSRLIPYAARVGEVLREAAQEGLAAIGRPSS